MRYLILIACLLVPSFGHSHMSTYTQEFAAHHMSSGGDNWGQTILNDRPEAGMWGYQYNVLIDPSKWYALLEGNVNSNSLNNGVNYLDNPLDTVLLHDIKLSNQNDCFSVLKYLGYIYNAPVENVTDANDGVYTLVYTSFYNKDPLISLSYTTTYDDVNSELIYDIYGNTYQWIYDSGEVYQIPLGVITSPPISIMRKKSIYDSYVEQYLYVYDFYKAWDDYFTATEFLNAVIADNVSGEYAFATPVVCDYGSTYSYLTLKILGLFTGCESNDNWSVTLGAFQNGSVNRVSGWTRYPWEIWLKPTFSGADSVKIYEWSGYSKTSFPKNVLVQDETIYTSGGVDYQGTAYWEVRLTYLGQSYRLRLYGSDPPCRDVNFDGSGVRNSGKGAKEVGRGVRFRGGGGIVQTR